jgi:hypothetical protein
MALVTRRGGIVQLSSATIEVRLQSAGKTTTFNTKSRRHEGPRRVQGVSERLNRSTDLVTTKDVQSSIPKKPLCRALWFCDKKTSQPSKSGVSALWASTLWRSPYPGPHGTRLPKVEAHSGPSVSRLEDSQGDQISEMDIQFLALSSVSGYGGRWIWPWRGRRGGGRGWRGRASRR